ncbi:MAG: FkbM family methyltransferase [Rickettsiales bacterium]|nr:FkbM family methyltransferase [Rickettsiales bacterium]
MGQGARRCVAEWLGRQRALPYKTRRSLLKKIDPAMLRDYSFDAPFFSASQPLRFRGNIINYIDRLIYFTGAHEKYMLALLKDYTLRLKATGQAGALVFVDVGANAGNHALFMSQLADRVLAFEPFARVREQMEENLALNHITNVQVFPFALSDKEETLPFYASGESNLGASSFAKAHKQDSAYLGDMQLRVGDAVLREMGITQVDILKVDVEGFEKPVLRGLTETISASRPLMVVEFTETTRKDVENVDVFRSLFPEDYGFYYFAQGNANTGRYRLESYSYGMTPHIEDIIACPDERVDLLLHTDFA